jgi:hypothetical protein
MGEKVQKPEIFEKYQQWKSASEIEIAEVFVTLQQQLQRNHNFESE